MKFSISVIILFVFSACANNFNERVDNWTEVKYALPTLFAKCDMATKQKYSKSISGTDSDEILFNIVSHIEIPKYSSKEHKYYIECIEYTIDNYDSSKWFSQIMNRKIQTYTNRNWE